MRDEFYHPSSDIFMTMMGMCTSYLLWAGFKKEEICDFIRDMPFDDWLAEFDGNVANFPWHRFTDE